MSRIGKQLIDIPTGVTVVVNSNQVTVTGPKGELKLNVAPKINVEVKDNQVFVTRVSEDKKTRSNHGTTRAHINNMIKGVTELWKKELEIKYEGEGLRYGEIKEELANSIFNSFYCKSELWQSFRL